MARDGTRYEDIAAEFGICQGRVRQIVAKDRLPKPATLHRRMALSAMERRLALARVKGFAGDARKYGVWIEA